MDTFTKQGILLVATVVGLMLILLLASIGGSDKNTGSPGITYDNSQENPQESAPESGSSTPSQENIDPKKWFKAPLKAGIPSILDLSLKDAPKELAASAIKLADDGKWLNVALHFTSTPRCMIGDLDLLLKEKAMDRDAPFLVSVEPLSSTKLDKEAIYSRNLAPAAMGSGTSITLKVPKSDVPIHYGLFICRDKARTGRCQDKRLDNVNELLTQHFSSKGANPPKDRVYFFQYLLQENNTFTAVNSLMKSSEYTKLEQYLGKRVKNTFSASSASAKAQKINQIIRSAPVKFEQESFIIDLPRHDRGLCKNSPVGPIPAELQRRLNKVNKMLKEKAKTKKDSKNK